MVLLFSFIEVIIVSSLLLVGKINIAGEENVFIKGILDHFSHTEELLKYKVDIDKYIGASTKEQIKYA